MSELSTSTSTPFVDRFFPPAWRQIAVTVLILLTLLIFFMTLRQTHRVLRVAKLAEENSLRR